MHWRSASELGQKYATQNYPSQGTPICKLHGPSIKPSQIHSDFYLFVEDSYLTLRSGGSWTVPERAVKIFMWTCGTCGANYLLNLLSFPCAGLAVKRLHAVFVVLDWRSKRHASVSHKRQKFFEPWLVRVFQSRNSHAAFWQNLRPTSNVPVVEWTLWNNRFVWAFGWP